MGSRPPSPPRSSPNLFWGFRLPAPPGLEAWPGRHHPALAGARWVHPLDLHLTLAFLGPRPSDEAPAILAAGAAALAALPPLDLTVTGLGAFPGLRAARVLWLGIQAGPALGVLVERLAPAMAPFGLTRGGPYRPHATLARLRSPVALPDLPPPEPFTARVDRARLLTGGPGPGPRYRDLGEVPLTAGPPPGP